MGKGTSQIATWKDLNTIGYRMPSQYRSSDECITYQDLEDLENSTDRTSHSVNVALDKSYFNGNTISGIQFTPDGNVPIIGSGTVGPPLISNESGVSNTYYLSLGRLINNLSTTEPIKLCRPDLKLYITLKPYISTLPNGIVYSRVVIKKGSVTGTTLVSGSWRPFIIHDAEDVQLRYDLPDKMPLYPTSLNETYYVVLEWYTDLPSSDYRNGVQISFKMSEPTVWDCYCSTMCVPWNRVNGSSAQVTSGDNAAKVPVLCYIEEHMSEPCSTLNCKFYYRYKLSGSDDWNMVQVGYTVLSTNSSGINGSAQNTCYVLINPFVSGNVVSDCLYVEVGNISVYKHWKFKVEYSGATPTAWVDSVNATSNKIMIDWSGNASLGSFNKTIGSLTGLYFYISA